MLAVDIETYDPGLKTIGDGSVRKDGYIICAGIYGEDCKKVFWWDDDIDRAECIRLLESNEDKCFHNGVYDMSWLVVGYDINVGGAIHDTMTRAAMIDEYQDLDLDTCCKKMGVTGKNKDDTIEAWFNDNKGVLGLKGTVWENVTELMQYDEFKHMMEKYNLQDCKATYELFQAQERYMAPYKEAYDIECRLYPLLMHMKKHGVRIDEEGLEKLKEQIASDLEKLKAEMLEKYNITPEVINSPKKLGEFMHSLGITSPLRTDKGAESWSAGALERIQHPVIAYIQEYKAKNTLLNKYLTPKGKGLANCIWKGRIHCTFSPNKREDGGTLTGRFACSAPNLQNISAREEKHGQKTYGDEMRSLFLPEEGQWMFACDYSQIEFLLFVANAYGPQAEWLKSQARAGVDFHDMAQDITGIHERFPVKCINYGTIYGMGIATLKMQNYIKFTELAEKAGKSFDEYVDDIYNTYHTKLPVIRDTMKHIEQVCRIQGYVTGIGGRRHHKPKPFFLNGKINDGLYKITNYKLQGDAAELLKKALVDAWDAGVFNVLTLHLLVHDEVVCSVPKTKEGVEAAVTLQRCMNNAYKDRLDVPVKSEGGIGDNWGAKHAEQEWKDLRVQYGFTAEDVVYDRQDSSK